MEVTTQEQAPQAPTRVLVSAAELARLSGKNVNTVYYNEKVGKIKAVDRDGHKLFDREQGLELFGTADNPAPRPPRIKKAVPWKATKQEKPKKKAKRKSGKGKRLVKSGRATIRMPEHLSQMVAPLVSEAPSFAVELARLALRAPTPALKLKLLELTAEALA